MLDEEVGLLIILIMLIDHPFLHRVFLSEEADNVGPQVDDSPVIFELILQLQTKVESLAVPVHALKIALLLIEADWVGPDIESICLFVFVF